jgi:non-ribosomal peptide synthase protein (TIGR01720 family)
MDMHELCNKVSTLTRGLIDELAALVPSSMVPSSFRPSHWTPQTATGKVDRRALAAEAAAVTEASLLFESMNLRTGRTTPFDRTEKTMQRVWADVLHLPVDEVPVDVPFARLRGDSISAMQVVGRCRAEGITLTMAKLLELQTIERLAAVDSERRETFVAEVGKDPQEAVTWNLSPIQKWYFEAHPAGINHYNQAYFAEISPEFTDSSLNQAVHALVERHGMLRARFIRNEPHQWHQRVLPYSPHVVRVMSYTAEDESEVRKVAARQQEMLDIIHGPVFAADIFTIGNKRQILLLTAHHLVIDVVSWSTIFYDLERLLLQRNEQLPSIVSFQTWCRMQETETMALVPKQALPAPLSPSDTYFWGFDASLNSYGDTKTLVSQLSAEATTFLLGYSNVSMTLEPVDLIVGALLHAFQAAFNTRSPPIVMLEGHGREPFEGSQGLDLSEVVGWFTTLCPIQIPWRATGGRLETIGQVYTIRRQIPGKGRPYFACRYLQAHQEWLDVFGGNSTPELVFNYFGTSTRFGAVHSPFRRFGTVPNQMSSQAKRLSIFDVTARIDAGQLSLELTFPRHLKRLEQIEQWWDIYVKALERLQVDLETHM